MATCKDRGGPGIATEEELTAGGGKLTHKDPAICANVHRNTKETKKTEHEEGMA